MRSGLAAGCSLGLLAWGLCAGGAEAAGRGDDTARVWMCRREPWVLGQHPEQWEAVGRQVGVISLYIDEIRRASEEDLETFARVIKARGIQIAVECAGLCDWRAKEGERVAEWSFQDEYRKVKRYLDAGGRVTYLQMDGPIRRMLYQRVDEQMTRTGHHTVPSAAKALAQVMQLWRQAVPGIEFFLLTNFPNWGYRNAPAYHGWAFTGEGERGWGDYDGVLRTVLEVLEAEGLRVRGITVDNPYDYLIGEFPSNQPNATANTDWIERVLDLERFVEKQDLEFGLIYNSSRAGSRESGSDALYARETLAYLDLYRMAGGSPANILVQSWYHYPSAYLPEDQPGTMTDLVREVILRLKRGQE